MRVTISTAGRFPPAYAWGRYLEERHLLERIVTPLPYELKGTAFGVSGFGVSKKHLLSLTPISVWSYIFRRLGHGGAQQWNQHLTMRLQDLVASRSLGACDVFNGWTGVSLSTIRAARSRGTPTVLQTGSVHIEHQDDLLRREELKFGPEDVRVHPIVKKRALEEYRLASCIVVPSQFVYNSFLERGIPAERLRLVPWPALPLAGAASTSEKQPGAKTRVTFAGACSLRKGIPYLLDAARLLTREVEVRLLGPFNPRFFSRLGGLPSNVFALGFKRGQELLKELRTADIFVLPSVEDGSAMAITEAMLLGLPVVVSDQSGAALVEDGVSGYVVPTGDSRALAERLSLLARDDTLRTRVGEEGRRAAEARTATVYGDELVRYVYTHLGNQPARPES